MNYQRLDFSHISMKEIMLKSKENIFLAAQKPCSNNLNCFTSLFKVEKECNITISSYTK